MKILIVEDETAASENLIQMLRIMEPSAEILAVLESVSQTVDWLDSHPSPDLIMMDIHLSDDSAFAIFKQTKVTAPIVFTTAYDQYAIDSFRVNSIDYLLKPIKNADLRRALDKFHHWTEPDISAYLERMLALQPAAEQTSNYLSALLIPNRDRLLPVQTSDIAFIYSTDKNTQVFLRSGINYTYNKTLDHIISQLNPASFFRANKQFIISREAVTEIVTWYEGRLKIILSVETPELLIVSKNKAAEFKKWLTRER